MTTTAVRSMRDRVGPLLDKVRAGELSHTRVRSEGFPTLSALLEENDPSTPEERTQGLDAFCRALAVADIRTVSDTWGSYTAHPIGRMADEREGGHPHLFAEWARRQWSASRRRARVAARQALQPRMGAAAAQFLSGDFLAGSIQTPYDDDTTLRLIQTEPAIPLGEIVARSRNNDGPDYRSRHLVQPAAADVRLLRVGEAAEIPKATLTETSRTIRLPKFGRGLEASYEAARRIPLDDFAVYLRLLAIQNEVDQVDAAVDVMINGDGNANTSATVHNLTTLDPATTANNLTVAAWMAFKALWSNPYMLTHIVGQQASIIKMLTLNVGTANTLAAAATVPTGLRTEWVPINGFTTEGIRYGILASAPANRLVGFDARFAVEHVQETGSEISEAERWVHRQTETLYFTVNEAFSVFLAQTRLLRLDA